MKVFSTIFILSFLFLLQACTDSEKETKKVSNGPNQFTKEELPQSDSAWKEVLTPEQFKVLRKQGTEKPFNNDFWDNKSKGDYTCAGCGQVLFESEKKFKSGTGWPSFTDPSTADAVESRSDNSLFRKRTEVICSKCDGHLGHVFDDGPGASGLRYCINSASLQFKEEK